MIKNELELFDENAHQDIDLFLDTELPKLTKKGKLRKRKVKESRIYFTQDTEDAIIEYIKTEDTAERNEIYNDRISHSFYKLCENIIHTFKFYYTDTDTIEELKHEVITFLLEKLHLYHHSKNINDKLTKIIVKEFGEKYIPGSFIEFTGNANPVTQQQIDEFILKLDVSSACRESISKLNPPKAYSYFGTIAKRYLINYNENNYQKLQEEVDITAMDEESPVLVDEDKSHPTELALNDFIDYYVKYFDTHMNTLFPKQKDVQTADAVVELFRRRESLEIFNKKALYIYIREITDADTPQITKIIKKLKVLYTTLYTEYYRTGHVTI